MTELLPLVAASVLLAATWKWFVLRDPTAQNAASVASWDFWASLP